MVDILQMLEGLAYVGFIAGAIFAVLELRGISKDRRTNIVVDLYNSFISAEVTEVYSKVVTEDFKNGADMEQKCSHSSLARLAAVYEGAGYLSRRRFVDPNVVMEFLPITAVWHKIRPWIVYDRERMGKDQWCEFEWLARATEEFNTSWSSPIQTPAAKRGA